MQQYPGMLRPVKFNFTCQRCGSVLEAESGMSGRSGRCPTCAAVFVIPAMDRRTGLPVNPAEVADDGQLPTPMHAYAAAGGRAPKIERLPDGTQRILCPRCNVGSDIDADVCRSCGMPFTMEGAESAGRSVGRPTGLATASLVCGVIGLPTFCVPVLGIAGIVCGVLALRRKATIAGPGPGRGMAIAGIICGTISTILAGLVYFS